MQQNADVKDLAQKVINQNKSQNGRLYNQLEQKIK